MAACVKRFPIDQQGTRKKLDLRGSSFHQGIWKGQQLRRSDTKV